MKKHDSDIQFVYMAKFRYLSYHFHERYSILNTVNPFTCRSKMMLPKRSTVTLWRIGRPGYQLDVYPEFPIVTASTCRKPIPLLDPSLVAVLAAAGGWCSQLLILHRPASVWWWPSRHIYAGDLFWSHLVARQRHDTRIAAWSIGGFAPSGPLAAQ